MCGVKNRDPECGPAALSLPLCQSPKVSRAGVRRAWLAGHKLTLSDWPPVGSALSARSLRSHPTSTPPQRTPCSACHLPTLSVMSTSDFGAPGPQMGKLPCLLPYFLPVRSGGDSSRVTCHPGFSGVEGFPWMWDFLV